MLLVLALVIGALLGWLTATVLSRREPDSPLVHQLDRLQDQLHAIEVERARASAERAGSAGASWQVLGRRRETLRSITNTMPRHLSSLFTCVMLHNEVVATAPGPSRTGCRTWRSPWSPSPPS